MNKIKFLILPLLLSVLFFSCSNSNYVEEVPPPVVVPDPTPEVSEELPVPLEPTAPFRYLALVDVSLSSNYSVKNEPTNNVVLNVKHSITNVQALAYVVHRKVDGVSVGGHVYGEEQIEAEVKDGVFSFGKNLLEGEYYVSVVAVMSNNGFHGILLEPMCENYKDAVVQIRNTYTYYGTMEIEVKPNKDAANRSAMHLKKMTTDLVFEFADINKLPQYKDKYMLAVGVENIPSAFYLATGITLTDKEVKAKDLYRYAGKEVFELPIEKTTKPLVVQFHSLANDNLENNANERGTYYYELLEKVEGNYPLVKRVSGTPQKYTTDAQFHLMTEYLLPL